MGVIRRQGIKHSIVTFTGVFLGMINVLFVYTYALTKTELGLIRYLISAATLIVPFISLGITSVAIRFFPNFKNEHNGHNGFLFFLLIIPLLGYFLFLVFIYFLKDNILSYFGNQEDAVLYIAYVPYIILLVLGIAYSYLLVNYCSNFKLIVVPSILNDLFLKVALPILSLSYFFDYISFNTLINFFVSAFLFIPIALLCYLWYLGELYIKPRFKFFKKPLVKEIGNYASYRFFGVIGTVAATQIDIYMVGTLIDLGSAGIYTIALFISTVVAVPMKSLFSISAPIIAESWLANNIAKIDEIYKKTSINLLIFGVLFLTGIWSSIDYIFDILPNGEDYRPGKYVVLILGLAKLVDMTGGVNTHIIAYSKLYRFDLYLSLTLAGLNILFNLLFIPKFGIVGAALATLTSMFIFNLVKFLFVLIKFKIQPFAWSMFWTLLLGVGLFGLTILIPDTIYPLLNIFINSIVISIIFIGVIFYFNVSEDITNLKKIVFDKVRTFY